MKSLLTTIAFALGMGILTAGAAFAQEAPATDPAECRTEQFVRDAIDKVKAESPGVTITEKNFTDKTDILKVITNIESLAGPNAEVETETTRLLVFSGPGASEFYFFYGDLGICAHIELPNPLDQAVLDTSNVGQ